MMGNVTLLEFLSMGREVANHRPWPRYQLDAKGWRQLAEQMTVSNWEILAEWGEPAEVHVLLRGEDSGAIAVASHPCPDGAFFALGQVRPAAIRLERAIRDLWGVIPEGLEDQRPWLDHGHWRVSHPLGHPRQYDGGRHIYKFLTAEGDGLHQIPVGPVHAGVIEPGHFRFHCQGETVVRLEERLGYVHKGIEGLLAGKPILDAARIAGRVSGDATVAYAIAFARAVEAALGQDAPPRAHWLRALMAELERVANHLFDIGAICNDAAFAIMLSHMGALREQILAANNAIFGHRLLMDRVVPGGVSMDLDEAGRQRLAALLPRLRHGFKRAVALYEQTPSLLDRTTGTGTIQGTLAHRFAVSGFVGRASSRSVDARRMPGYPPYDDLDFTIPVLAEGDVHARVQIRIEEVRASLSLIEQILTGLPGGAFLTALPMRAGEGVALVESFRGEVAFWVRLSETGKVVRAHPHDPSWFQWPLLEAAIEGNIVADFPLCNKSFNCSYSGHDL
ncbi:hydrogenase 4, subunit [Magnetospirillum gryphiswaldense MSR-1 v2]|uniref:Hydrogenase 4, subunit n=1 Tax=Magnetospirillum gryphiswaldense (strain DSM 6361 / JCM 21280 / NBRC 15271 / MSR-1) TaxID=431944 RepID=V6F5X7_MAGGM|nr:nickel-dependent hydrogenase large subunit [Magnetospirillum gryphiswaldense]CDK99898.1 hydrogenase 4, subunit [Magnetospirillum gryphiswaldense MSR-1 v2]